MVHLLCLLFVLLPLSLSPPRELLDLRLIALRAFLVFLFLPGILHVEVNGEAHELRSAFQPNPTVGVPPRTRIGPPPRTKSFSFIG